MFGTFERMVAFRYLRPRRKQGFISVISGFSLLGIGLGVATLIVVMAVMNGFRHELISRVLGLNGHMSIYGLGGPIAEFDERLEAVAELPMVVEAAPLVEGQGLVSVHGGASGAIIRGMRAEDFMARMATADHTYGTMADENRPDPFDARADQGPAIAIGNQMAERLGVWLGDELTLIAPEGSAGPFGTVPRMRQYRIASIFQIGMHEYDNSFVYMPLEAAQIFFRTRDAATKFDLFIEDPTRLADARDAVEDLAFGWGRVWDWQDANSSLVNALQVERNVMFVILTLIILVAAFNIISGLVMLVKDKGRDIAILRTMGASRGMVLRIFFVTGSSIGVAGTLLGVALGLLIADNIATIQGWAEYLLDRDIWNAELRFLAEVPALIDWGEVSMVVAMAVGLSFLATLYPSWRAARLDPVEALRYE